MRKTIFIGDSVTDCDRLDFPPYGNGYVREIAESGRVEGEVINVGVSGNRLVDLVERWDRDVIAQRPNRLSINIGINDTWRRYDDQDPTDMRDFERNYRAVLDRTLAAGEVELVLCEPFLLPVSDEMRTWREDLDPKLDVIHQLAAEYNAILVPFDQRLTDLASRLPMQTLAEDGIHPTALGHVELARLWLSCVVH